MATGLTVIKRMTYRGDPNEEFSNTYWLSGSTPADATAWRALFDALVTQEKTLYNAAVQVIRGYGYDDDSGDGNAVWSVDLTVSPETVVPGTLSTTGAVVLPGDNAVWVRWKTGRLTVKGKPIYLRKYFHAVARATSPTVVDEYLAAQRTAMLAFGTKLMDGTFLSARHVVAAGHSSDTIVSRDASVYPTTRTLKRRGKRPGA